jgi:general L-amino acid transport system substrate-binding protein
MGMRFPVFAALLLTSVMGAAAPAAAGPTLDAVKGRGALTCGVNTSLFGFSAPDDKGVWKGLDVDMCRAVAAAVLGDAAKVKYVPLTAQARFTALQSGEIDMLSRNTTWTLTRATANGLNFTPVTYFDGQGFLVAKKLGVAKATDLKGATVCVQTGTTTELNLADFSRAKKLDIKPVTIEKLEEATSAFVAGRCDAFTSDASQLASIRANSTPNPADYVILPELISKEPFAAAVRQGDDQWYDIVSWSIFAMIEAEERNMTSANVEAALKSEDPNIKRILGVTPGFGQALGIDEKWAYNIIKQVGNYGESFERNVGVGSKLQLSRGLNAQWYQGGLMYAPPFR